MLAVITVKCFSKDKDYVLITYKKKEIKSYKSLILKVICYRGLPYSFRNSKCVILSTLFTIHELVSERFSTFIKPGDPTRDSWVTEHI